MGSRIFFSIPSNSGSRSLEEWVLEPTLSLFHAGYVGGLMILYITDETMMQNIVIGEINLQVACQKSPGRSPIIFSISSENFL